MLSIVLKDLWSSIKNNWATLLVYGIIYFCISLYLGRVLSMRLFPALLTETENRIVLSDTSVLSQHILLVGIVTMVMLYVLFHKIPLRLSKGMFLFPLGEKEKYSYLVWQLFVKFIFSFVFSIASACFFAGAFFIVSESKEMLIQISIWFFLILNVNLKVGLGEDGRRKTDYQGYQIYTKEEEMIYFYWICILAIEAIVFYSFVIVAVPINTIMVMIWGGAFVLNTFIACKCTKPILKKSMSYEAVYLQVPDK